MEINKYSSKRVRIVLKNDFTYVGKIISEGDSFLKIRDKYDKLVFISLSEIKTITEVEE